MSEHSPSLSTNVKKKNITIKEHQVLTNIISNYYSFNYMTKEMLVLNLTSTEGQKVGKKTRK